MRIKSSLKAGGVVDSVTRTTENLIRPAANFIGQANQQAQKIPGSISRTATSAWNSLTSLVS